MGIYQHFITLILYISVLTMKWLTSKFVQLSQQLKSIRNKRYLKGSERERKRKLETWLCLVNLVYTAIGLINKEALDSTGRTILLRLDLYCLLLLARCNEKK